MNLINKWGAEINKYIGNREHRSNIPVKVIKMQLILTYCHLLGSSMFSKSISVIFKCAKLFNKCCSIQCTTSGCEVLWKRSIE